MSKRHIEKRLNDLETDPADLPKVGLSIRFAMLEWDWQWVDKQRRILRIRDELYHDGWGMVPMDSRDDDVS